MRSRRRAGVAAAAVLTAVTVVMAGCASDGADDDTNASVAAEAAVLVPAAPGELDPGSHRTTAGNLHSTTVVGTGDGMFVESERLAEFVTLPVEIDPEVNGDAARNNGTVAGPRKLSGMFMNRIDDVLVSIAEDNGFYAGWFTGRSTPKAPGANVSSTRRVGHAVLQFPDADSARAAAVALHRDRLSRQWSMLSESPPPVDYPIASLPGSFVAADENEYDASVSVLTPYRRHVIYTWVSAPIDQKDRIEPTLIKALDLQRPLLDRFPVTEPEDLASLKMDLDGVLRLTVPYEEGDEVALNNIAVLGPRGAAHLAEDPTGLLEALTATDTTNFAVNKTDLYKSTTASGAEELFDRLPGLYRNVGPGTAVAATVGPPGVPNVRCFDVVTTMSTYSRCMVRHGQYIGEAFGGDLTEAHQKITAQYMILDSAAAEK